MPLEAEGGKALGCLPNERVVVSDDTERAEGERFEIDVSRCQAGRVGLHSITVTEGGERVEMGCDGAEVEPGSSADRGLAEKRRRSFRHAVGAFLDLVAISLAGGTGIEGALHGSVALGRGWGFARLGEALDHARLAGQTPWVALARVGEDLGVSELRELAASLVLAGHEGAKVRQSLAAKAASVRLHQLADLESEAAEATERMVLPIGLLFFGFLVFIGYPAVAAIITGI
mgnify:CR=1 FL=1